MPYVYSDPTREADPHSLPDCETFKGYSHQCVECSFGPYPLSPSYYGLVEARGTCEVCGGDGQRLENVQRYWYAYGFPGCLWDSEPVGPFDTEDEALADMRENAC